MARKKKDEYDAIYEDSFAIGFDFKDGKIQKKTKFIDDLTNLTGKLNVTDSTTEDDMLMTVTCSKCGMLMDYEPGGWMGKYVCPICSASVSEADPINQLNENSKGIFDDNEYMDIF